MRLRKTIVGGAFAVLALVSIALHCNVQAGDFYSTKGVVEPCEDRDWLEIDAISVYNTGPGTWGAGVQMTAYPWESIGLIAEYSGGITEANNFDDFANQFLGRNSHTALAGLRLRSTPMGPNQGLRVYVDGVGGIYSANRTTGVYGWRGGFRWEPFGPRFGIFADGGKLYGSNYDDDSWRLRAGLGWSF